MLAARIACPHVADAVPLHPALARNAHMASPIVNVSITSGISTRVKRNKPTQTAMVSPEYRPALRPKAQMPNAAVSQRESNTRERNRNACRPVMDAENFIGAGHQPINQRRLFKVRHAIQPRGYVVAGREHVAGNLRLDGVNVVLQVRRRDYAREVYQGRAEDDDQVEIAIPSGCSCCRVDDHVDCCIRHLFIHWNRIINPQR